MIPMIVLAMMLVAPMSSALALDKSITVTGDATVAVAPDLVTIRLGVASPGKTARDASETNAKAMTAVLAAIKDGGVAENDIKTARLSLQPQYDQNKSGTRLTGFLASNDISIRLKELDRLANIIDRAISSGANEISGIEFSLANQSPLLDDARVRAIADARRKAEIYAKAAGVAVGNPTSIAESPAPPSIRPQAAFRANSTPVMPGELTIHASVTVSYELTH